MFQPPCLTNKNIYLLKARLPEIPNREVDAIAVLFYGGEVPQSRGDGRVLGSQPSYGCCLKFWLKDATARRTCHHQNSFSVQEKQIWNRFRAMLKATKNSAQFYMPILRWAKKLATAWPAHVSRALCPAALILTKSRGRHEGVACLKSKACDLSAGCHVCCWGPART